MMKEMSDEVSYELLSSGVRACPHPTYPAMRESAPLYHLTTPTGQPLWNRRASPPPPAWSF